MIEPGEEVFLPGRVIPRAFHIALPIVSLPHILFTIRWGVSVLGISSGFPLKTLVTYAALGRLIIFKDIIDKSWVWHVCNK